MILTNAKERGRFLRFAVVGAAGAVIDFGVFNLLTNLITFFKQNVVWASVISFILAVISNFTWNRLWTYPDSRSKPLSRQLFQFVIVSVIGLLVRTPIFSFLEKSLTRIFSGRVTIGPISSVMVAHNLALATVILIVMVWNFIANRFWTYNDVKSS